MKKLETQEEAKKYFEENFLPAAAAKRLANWIENNPETKKAKKEDKKEE